jgi:hypothetical protein
VAALLGGLDRVQAKIPATHPKARADALCASTDEREHIAFWHGDHRAWTAIATIAETSAVASSGFTIPLATADKIENRPVF